MNQIGNNLKNTMDSHGKNSCVPPLGRVSENVVNYRSIIKLRTLSTPVHPLY